MNVPPELAWRGKAPPDYVAVLAWRQQRLLAIRARPALAAGMFEYYRTRPVEFVDHWCVTYDPRNPARGLPATVPFVTFDRQAELVAFVIACIDGEADGLVEKARDMGATWVLCAVSVWLWLYRDGTSVGWGSRKEALVDKLGDADSIFEKMRIILRNLPAAFIPAGYKETEHATHMRIVNPVTGSTVTGEAGDNIGRGGRKTVYFKDEAAHYERPEKIEAALGDNTRTQIDISSVNGPGNVFHRRRDSGVDWYAGAPVAKRVANVFVMDWADHPAKDQAWFDERRAKAVGAGLLHVFEQEVCRNYAAAVEGTIIQGDWIKAAIGAHTLLGFDDDGQSMGALDVAGGDTDGNLNDRNAFGHRKGVVLKSAIAWGDRDPGVTARKAVALAREAGCRELQYDAVGVGAAVKAEANRLADDDLLTDLEFVPWNGGFAPLDPDATVIPDDPESPTNGDFFHNLKAQGYWLLARRFEKTFRCVQAGELLYPVEELISLSPDIASLRELGKELSQPVRKQSAKLKMLVDKTPPGTRSPNLADTVMMLFHPVNTGAYTLANL